MNTLDLIVAAVTPGIALALIMYLLDKQNKEPMRLLIKLFLFGMLISIPVVLVEMALAILNPFDGIFLMLFQAFIIAGLTEEWFKRRVVFKHAYKNKAFDERFDGIVYAVFVSLGFATLENILYIVGSYQEIPHLWMTRAVISVPGHMLFAITMGYYIALAKYAPDAHKEKQYKRNALIYPMLFHGSFNFLLSLESTGFIFLFLGFIVFLWIINLIRLSRLYKISKVHEIGASYYE